MIGSTKTDSFSDQKLVDICLKVRLIVVLACNYILMNLQLDRLIILKIMKGQI